MSSTNETRGNRSLLERLPEIVRAGKRQAEQILESLEGKTRIGLQTRELVTPAGVEVVELQPGESFG